MKTVYLPPISQESVSACNRLYSGTTEVRFSCSKISWTLRFTGQISASLWHMTLHFSVGDFPVTVFLDGNLLVDWVDSGLDAATVSTFPSPLLSALLEVRLEELITALEPKLGKPVVLERLDLPNRAESAFPVEGSVPFQLTREDGQRLCGLLLTGPEVLMFLVAALARESPKAEGDWHLLAGLPIHSAVVLGKMSLLVSELRSIELGDSLFPDIQDVSGLLSVPELTTEGRKLPASMAVTESFRAYGTWHNGTFCVEDIHMANTTSATTSEKFFSPDDIPVSVQFEIGSVQTTVGDLAALKVGHVFTTGRNVDSPVRITVNGVLFGEGVLVDVNGVLGVRVASMGNWATHGKTSSAEIHSATVTQQEVSESKSTSEARGTFMPATELRS